MYSKLSEITQKWVDILEVYTQNYSSSLTSTQIERISNIPQQTISRVLNELLSLGFIFSKTEGKNKYFYLNLEENKSKYILEIVENIKALNFNLNRKEIYLIVEELLDNCDSIILFGSYANYTNTNTSDLDLIVVNGNEKELNKIKQKYTLEINYENIKYSNLKKKSPLLEEIKQNHIFFGNISKLVKIFIENER